MFLCFTTGRVQPVKARFTKRNALAKEFRHNDGIWAKRQVRLVDLFFFRDPKYGIKKAETQRNDK
jgi:hypothetical protein